MLFTWLTIFSMSDLFNTSTNPKQLILFSRLQIASHDKGRLFLLKLARKASKPGNKFTGPKNKEFWRKYLSLSHCLPLRRAWGVYLTCFNYWLTGPNCGCWTTFTTRSISFPLMVFQLMKPHLSSPSPIHACIRRQGICSQTINHLIRENVFSFPEKYCLLHLYVSLVCCYRI